MTGGDPIWEGTDRLAAWGPLVRTEAGLRQQQATPCHSCPAHPHLPLAPTPPAANFSGSGYERNQNGTSALTTAWAQPSGLALAPGGDALFVAGGRGGRRAWRVRLRGCCCQAAPAACMQPGVRGHGLCPALEANLRKPTSRCLVLPLPTNPAPADSESSSVRRLDLGSGGSRLLVGGDPMFSDNLFRFGDKVRQN